MDHATTRLIVGAYPGHIGEAVVRVVVRGTAIESEQDRPATLDRDSDERWAAIDDTDEAPCRVDDLVFVDSEGYATAVSPRSGDGAVHS